MARSNIIKTLERKYARLLGQQRTTPSRAIAADLRHVEAVLRMFEATWDRSAVTPIAPRAPIQWGGRGIGVRFAATVLRQARGPLSSTEIARAAYLASGLSMPAPRAVTLSGADLIWSLRRYFGERLAMIEGRPRRYQLMPPAANIQQTPAKDATPSPAPLRCPPERRSLCGDDLHAMTLRPHTG
jgi:hypothetical protein